MSATSPSRPHEAGAQSEPRPVGRSWRRNLRISMRGLVILVLVIGGGLGWLVRSAKIQREAVAAIRHAGGRVAYDWGYPTKPSGPAGKLWPPRWLVNLIGVDYFGHVSTIWLGSSSKATAPIFAHVGRLAGVDELNLNRSAVNDAGLAHLKGLNNVSTLILGHTDVTDAGLAHLSGMSSLTTLELDHTQVTDAGLLHLKGLTNLSKLTLGGTRVSDAGLPHLKRLNNLEVLWIDDTSVSDAGLPDLKRLTRLSRLVLVGTKISGAGTKDLQKALPKLTIDPISFFPRGD